MARLECLIRIILPAHALALFLGPLNPANFQRTWKRVQRRGQKEGARPLKLHTTRHTWASMALAAGKSVRWVADQLGHSSPTLTLKTYAHAMREEEVDLSFAEFGSPKRHYAAPPDLEERNNENAPGLNSRGRSGNLEHETGFEPATSTLATCAKTPKSLRIPARKPQGAAPSRSSMPVWARSGHAVDLASHWSRRQRHRPQSPHWGRWMAITPRGAILDQPIEF